MKVPQPTNAVGSMPRRRWLRWSIGSAAIGAVVVLVAVHLWPAPARLEPPAPDLTNIDHAVRASVEQAQQDVRQAPDSAEAWGRLGMILSNQVFAKEALTCFLQAEAFDPDNPAWPYRQALVLYAEDPASALPKLERAVALCGNRPDRPRLRLAELYLQLGRAADAQREFEALLQQQSGHPRANLGRARIHFQAEDWTACRARLQPALKHPLTRNAALRLSAELYQRQGDTQAAARDLAAALALPDDPDWPDPFLAEAARHLVGEWALNQKIAYFLDRQRFREARTLLEELVGDYPQSAQGWMQLGWCQLNLHQYTAGEQALHTALKLAPASAHTLQYLGTARMLQKDHPAAIAWFRKSLAQAPDMMQTHFNLAVCLKEEGDLAGGIAALRDAVRCRPHSAVLHAKLGDWLLQNQQPDEAVRHLQEAVELRPDDAATRKLLEEGRKRQANPIPKRGQDL